ncbi:hypothetical protein ACIA8H_12850 [Streptomyces goshikiensis]|uniref:hypothetical protein n=1 Tax=Streptomyces goshikiensis TaxID=1942 RepID=UPI0037ABEF25
MTQTPEWPTSLPYGESVVHWRDVHDELAPPMKPGTGGSSPTREHPDAAELHRLRGLIMAQGTETEMVLYAVHDALHDAEFPDYLSARQALRDIRKALKAKGMEAEWSHALKLIGEAMTRRNSAVHQTVEPLFKQPKHEVVDGELHTTTEWRSLSLGASSTDELRADLALQQHATRAAVRLYIAVW